MGLNVLEELLNEAQPGYVDAVRNILLRFRDTLGAGAFADMSVQDFPLQAARLIAASDIASGERLQLIADLSSLGWWCNLELTDEAGGILAALARRTHFR